MQYEQAAALNSAIRTIGMRHRALAGALLGRLGLGVGQEVFLLALAADGPLTQAQLATAGGCEPPTVTLAVRKLEAAGLVDRTPSPHDARAILVDLSEKGRALLPELESLWLDLATRTVAALDVPVDELLAVLDPLARSLSAAEAPERGQLQT